MSRAGTSAPSGAMQERARVSNDADLVAACRVGDEAAWEELVERFSPYVYGIAARCYRLGDAQAEDVFQEVFARTYEHVHRVRNESPLRPWIGQLARRLRADRLQRASGGLIGGTGGLSGVDDVLGRFDEAFDARVALADLPAHCREVLERFFCREESYTTIAAALDIPPATVVSRISDALDVLSKLLEGREPSVRSSRGEATR